MQSKEENANQQLSSPKSLSEILAQSNLLTDSESTSTPSKENSLTTISQKENQGQIGKHLSEHGLSELRNMAQSVKQGNLLENKNLLAFLKQQYGQQSVCTKEVFHDSYGNNGYECKLVATKVNVSKDIISDRKLLEAIEYFNRQASVDFVAKKVSELRSVMASKAESQEDLETKLEVYSAHLSQYPPDAVAFVIDRTIAKRKWFPLISELIEELNEIVSLRRGLLKAIKEKNEIKSITKQEEEWKPTTEEEKQAVENMMKNFWKENETI